jgi:hypothetical protein
VLCAVLEHEVAILTLPSTSGDIDFFAPRQIGPGQ